MSGRLCLATPLYVPRGFSRFASEIVFSIHTGPSQDIRDWLVEDLFRRETRLFLRNLPFGCACSPGIDHKFHFPLRFSSAAALVNRSGHEMPALPDRYLEIVAAAESPQKSLATETTWPR